MKSDVKFLIELAVSFVPFILFAIYNSKANIKKERRNRQYPMPIFAVVYTMDLPPGFMSLLKAASLPF